MPSPPPRVENLANWQLFHLTSPATKPTAMRTSFETFDGDDDDIRMVMVMVMVKFRSGIDWLILMFSTWWNSQRKSHDDDDHHHHGHDHDEYDHCDDDNDILWWNSHRKCHDDPDDRYWKLAEMGFRRPPSLSYFFADGSSYEYLNFLCLKLLRPCDPSQLYEQKPQLFDILWKFQTLKLRCERSRNFQSLFIKWISFLKLNFLPKC